jgi:hypothetical protein|eukprot:COSAG02_NODE_747_length_17723_cov_49.509816_18_plen_136_part_00
MACRTDELLVDNGQTTIRIDEAIEGTTTRLIPCKTHAPIQYYNGNLRVHCPAGASWMSDRLELQVEISNGLAAAGSDQWEINNTCIKKECPAENVSWPSGPDPESTPAFTTSMPVTSMMAGGRMFPCCQVLPSHA